MNYTEIFMLIEPYLSRADRENYKAIEKLYNSNPEIFVKPFFDILNNLFIQVIEKQKRGEKGRIEYIYFSMLHSNIILEKHALRIDIYDERNVCDKVEISDEWKPAYIFEMYKDVIKQAEKILSSNYIPVKDYEIKRLYKSYVTDYYLMAVGVLKRMLEQVHQLESYKMMQKEKEIKIIFGEYMDKCEIIYCINDEVNI